MQRATPGAPRGLQVAFRSVCYLCAVYFALMGLALILIPGVLLRSAGAVNPIILGILRGAGGSILPYSLLYVLVARSPDRRRWALAVLAIANVAAITLDLLSVHLGEYRLSHALLDAPLEALSLAFMVIALTRPIDDAVRTGGE